MFVSTSLSLAGTLLLGHDRNSVNMLFMSESVSPFEKVAATVVYLEDCKQPMPIKAEQV